MVSAWWLLGAFFVGGYAGILVMALMSVNRTADLDEDEEEHETAPSTD